MALFGEDRRLAKLKRSILFSPNFPKRTRFTHAEWAAAGDEERRASHEPSTLAIGRVKNWHELAELVKELAGAKVVEAVPVLATLWADCPLQPVRIAVGHALREMGTAGARKALVDQIEDHEHLSVFLAVRALFDEDPRTAFERCVTYFDPERIAEPAGDVIPNEVLRTFSPGAFVSGGGGHMVPQWTEPRAPQWFRDDPRWLRLCVDLRRDPFLGATARDVLRHADQEAVAVAIDDARAREGPQIITPSTRLVGDLVSRYRAGEYEAVWNTLRSFDAISGDLREEAHAVAVETMNRVAAGADLLAGRLAAMGWQPLYDALRTTPQADDQQVMRRIEELAGAPLPPSLRAFWEVVGGINFIWNYDLEDARPDICGLEIEELDPLCVDPASSVSWQFKEWEEQREGVDPELWDPLELSLAPDYLHKANISGGAPYGIELPFRGADPSFKNERHDLAFVDYLRLSIQWAGFPGLSEHADDPDVIRLVKELTKSVEPF